MAKQTLALTILLTLLTIPTAVFALEMTPFRTSNQSPLIQIYGLPSAERSAILSPAQKEIAFSLDLASSYTTHRTASESILLDGETSRLNLSWRQGILTGLEAGIDIPVIWHRGGFLDGFIENWHSFFALPQGGRDTAPKNRLDYVYVRSNQTQISLTDNTEGLGDLRFSLGWQLMKNERERGQGSVALRASLKLPTGDSDRLLGSGSTDFALQLNATTQQPGIGGDWAFWGGAGLLVMSDGDVLRDQQRHLAGFGTLGMGWSPTSWIAFKLQVDGHTPFYDDSELVELESNSAQLAIGGSLGFSPRTVLDIGVTEDIVVDTAPDVVFHLALRHSFP